MCCSLQYTFIYKRRPHLLIHYLLILLSIYLSIYLSLYQSIYLSLHLSIYLFIYLSISISLYLYICIYIFYLCRWISLKCRPGWITWPMINRNFSQTKSKSNQFSIFFIMYIFMKNKHTANIISVKFDN